MNEGLQCITSVHFILRVKNKIVEVSIGYSERSADLTSKPPSLQAVEVPRDNWAHFDRRTFGTPL